MKRMLSILLTICMVLNFTPGVVLSAKAVGHHDDWSAITMGSRYIKIDGVEQTSNTIPSGNYYLDESFTVNSILSIEQDAVVNLCLNNQTLSFTSYYYIMVDEGATLSVSDCGSQGTISAGISGNAPTVEVYHSVFNLNGGTLVNNGPSIPGRGAVYNYNGTFNMTGGTVSGKYCGIYLESLGPTNISGGLIEARESSSLPYPGGTGFAIYMEHGPTLCLSGSPSINGRVADIYSERLIASRIYANDRADTPTYYSGAALTIYAGSADLTSSYLGRYAVNGVNSGNQNLFSLLNENYHFEIDETNQNLTLHGDNVSLSWMDGETNLTDTTSDYPSTAEYSQTITLPCPEKDGFIFMGWSDGSKTYSLGSQPSVKADMVLTAQWVEMFSGNGTKEEPYEISSVEDLQKLGILINKGYEYLNNSGVYYVLTNDLDIGAVCGSNINGADVSWAPIGTFCANFDGNNKTIANLYINNGDDTDTDSGCCGLFSHISNSTIKDLTLENVNITAGYASGTLAGVAENSTISNITVTGAVSGLFDIGALAGLQSSNNLSNINTSGVSVLMDGVSVSHSYNLTVTEPTCTNNGYTTHACTICGESYIDTFVNATGHSYTVYTLNDDATCETDGTETATCDNGCGTTNTRTVEGSRKEHNWQSTEDPFTQKCTYCSETKFVQISGICGNKVTWTLDADGLLAIEGTGDMYDYQYNTVPWGTYKYDIKTAVIGDGVTRVGNHAFYHCTSLTSISMPNSIKSLGYSAFKDCSALTDIEIPDGVVTIEDSVFSSCHALTEIAIPRSVVSIRDTFSCANLAKIIVDENNPNYCSVDGVLFTRDMKTLVRYPESKNGTSYAIPIEVVEIDNNAFESCDLLTSVSIPTTVTTIGAQAFRYCSKLTDITIPCSVSEIAIQAFCDSGLKNVTFSGNAPSIGSYAFLGVTATCYYPSNDITWTSVKKANYGGNLTWNNCASCSAHSFTNYRVTNEATCLTNASETAKCDFCKETNTREVQNSMLEHVYVDYVSNHDATCEEDGTKTALCDYGCGTSNTCTDERSRLGHDKVSHAAKAPTCTEIGWDAYVTCSRCDYTTYVEKNKLGHDEVNHAAKAPTCTEIGWNAYVTCSRCDYSTYVEKSKLGHDEMSHDAKAPTCSEIGWDAYTTCSRCDYSTYVEKSKLGHDEVSHAAKAPTCTEIGWDAYVTCSRCDYTTYVEKNKLGHDEVNHAAKAPTCTEIGWNAYVTCSRCDYTTYEEKSKLGHDEVSHDAKAPTCTEFGWDAYVTCSRCDYSTCQEIEATGEHIYTDYVSNEDATCFADGTKTAKCDYGCGAESTQKDVGSRLSHSYDDYGVCIHCGTNEEILDFYFEVSRVKGLAGDTVEVRISMEGNPGIVAACMEVSYDAERLTLVRVDDTELLNDGIFSRDYTANPYLLRWEDSTATTNNTATGTIAVLTFQIAEDCPLGKIPVYLGLSSGEIYNTSLKLVEASSVNGCIEVVDVLPGDANGNGSVNSIDVTLFRRYLAKWENVQIIESAMDVNNDGLVNSLDVTVLRRYLAGWSNVSLMSIAEPMHMQLFSLQQGDPLCFNVSDVSGLAGEEVTVTISMENNPGIIAACMNLSYDSDKLELLSVTDSGLLNDGTFSETIDSNPYALRWEDSLATVNNTENGVIATLKFRILEDSKPGTTALTLSLQTEEVYDADLQPVEFEINQGEVTIEEEKTVIYDAVTGTVTLHSWPEDTEFVFIAAYEDGKMISIIPGMLGSNNEVPSAADADEIKVFYLGSGHNPVADDYKIDLS